MPEHSIDLEQWLDTFREATVELAGGMLRFEGLPVPPPDKHGSGNHPGAYIGLFGDGDPMRLGISSTPQGCRALARGLLGLRFDSELSDQDVMDGCSEVINILAGKVKSRMMAHDGTLRLGLPIFLIGQITVTANMDQATTEVRVGPVDCRLHVFRTRTAA